MIEWPIVWIAIVKSTGYFYFLIDIGYFYFLIDIGYLYFLTV